MRVRSKETSSRSQNESSSLSRKEATQSHSAKADTARSATSCAGSCLNLCGRIWTGNENAGIKRTQVMMGLVRRHAARKATWFRTGSGSQWALPTNENYEWLRSLLNANGGDFLARPYEELRSQYEELRRPFNVTAEDQYTDVWTYTTVVPYDGKHPCEKPEAMARDIVRISSRQNDVVLVFFAGSGIFASEALRQGRRVIAVEMDPQWAAVAEQRCIEAINGQASTMTAPCMPPMRRKATRANTPPQLSLFQHIH